MSNNFIIAVLSIRSMVSMGDKRPDMRFTSKRKFFFNQFFPETEQSISTKNSIIGKMNAVVRTTNIDIGTTKFNVVVTTKQFRLDSVYIIFCTTARKCHFRATTLNESWLSLWPGVQKKK